MINFKKGFTLSEVMITLALIGIIAAISIPSITADHQKRISKNKIRNAMVTFDSLIRNIDVSLGRNVTTEDIKEIKRSYPMGGMGDGDIWYNSSKSYRRKIWPDK